MSVGFLNIFKKINNSGEASGKFVLNKDIVKKYNATRPTNSRKYICNAPFTALRFDLYGQVLACCYNKTQVLGHYPADSIEEIWKGEKVKELRKHIADKDLSLGCYICRDQILKGSFSAVKSKLYDHLKPNSHFPVLIELELDNTCNLECIMCNGEASSLIRKNEKNRPLFEKKYNADFIEQLKPFLQKVQYINFIGGEPFLIPIYYDIIDEITRANPNVTMGVTSNGTILNDKIKKILEEGNFDISISIDSINKETYESIRKNADFETTISNLHYFHNYCLRKKRHFCVWVCPLKINRFEIPDIFDFFNGINVPVYLNNVLHPRNQTIANLEEEELEKLRSHYKSYVFKNKTSASFENHIRFNDFVNQLDEWIKFSKNIKMLKEKAQNTDKIESIIKDKLKTHYKRKFEKNATDFNSFFEIAQNKINKIHLMVNDEKGFKDILFYFLSYDVEEIAQILETKTEELIYEYSLNDFFKS